MTPAEMPELFEERSSPAAGAAPAGARPANDNTGAARDAMSSSSLLRLGSALVVAGGAVIVGVLMAAIAVRFGDRAPVRRAPPASPREGAARRATASAPASPAST